MPPNIGSDVSGVIFPLMQTNIDIILKREKPVYVRFITHSGTKRPTRLRVGNVLLLYVSRKDRSVTHYARIKSVSFISPEEVLVRYSGRIQMEEEEFREYIRGRESKSLLFLELGRIKRLVQPYRLDRSMTMAGRYVSREELHEVLEVEGDAR